MLIPAQIKIELPTDTTWGDLAKGDVIVHQYANGRRKNVTVVTPAGEADERGIAKMQVRTGETGQPYIINVRLGNKISDLGAVRSRIYRTCARLRDGITWGEVRYGDVIRTTYQGWVWVDWIVLREITTPDPATGLGVIVVASDGMPLEYQARPGEAVGERNQGVTTAYRPVAFMPTTV
ncbi:hypothetical protein [Thermobispora bispora]|uniref:hypothetical protein n=1 Tax=Thermobispora bispora TaxID=2006 RepID=UPI00197F9D8B|nr:hypothetical protein [Thermobispora bispora]QSI50018.1 hypothetical protein CYL17_18785 [Thermobispora bispora]